MPLAPEIFGDVGSGVPQADSDIFKDLPAQKEEPAAPKKSAEPQKLAMAGVPSPLGLLVGLAGTRLGKLTANSANEGIASIPDALLNTPTNVMNLAKAAVGAPMAAMGRPDLAPQPAPTPDYVRRGMQSLGFIRPELAPQNTAERIYANAVKAGVGGMVAPAQSVPQLVSNAITGGVSGAAGSGVAEATGRPELGMATQMLAIPAIGAVTNAIKASSETSMAKNRLKDEAAAQARAEGYKIPPTQTNPTLVNQVLEGTAGKTLTQQKASVKNQEITNDLIRKDLNLPENEPVTVGALEKIRDQAGQAYNAIRKENFVATPEFKAQVNGLGREYQAMVKDVPEMADPKIDGLIKALDKPQFSGETAVALIKRLRSHGNTNLNSIAATPEAKDLGSAQISASKALEDMIEANLANSGKSGLLNDFRSARQTIAKTFDAEKALNDVTGDISAGSLARQLDKKPLTGGMQAAAQAGKAFPKATQTINSSVPGFSPLDVGVGSITASAMRNPGFLAGWLGVRPAVRSAILSDWYQNSLGTRTYPGAALPSQENLLLRALISGQQGALYQPK